MCVHITTRQITYVLKNLSYESWAETVISAQLEKCKRGDITTYCRQGFLVENSLPKALTFC